ncbi:MAG: hypothetical protein P8J50_17505 [Acidimicrobiales bacterium]|nr:hypothetical protein [Acidimicrobiales bacterium]
MHGTLTFTTPADVVPDEERPGLRRAQPNWEDGAEGDEHVCELNDLTDPETTEPGLEAAGFETVDLSDNAALQQVLAVVRDEDQISEASAAALRDSLTGVEFGLANGKTLRIDVVVDDGLFHRRSGPNWLDVNPGGITGTNGHSGAQHVHGDQDVFGTPLRQLLGGAAPDMFRHATPDGRNDHADTFLLNIWIPLHAPVQPLALMDRRSLDVERHQLRYGLVVDGFLERDEDATVNDIWSFLHDEGQQWYIRTDMGPDQAYVFDTLGTPHGAAVLPGENAVEALYLALGRACDAMENGDADALRAVVAQTPAPPVDASASVRRSGERMADLLAEATIMLTESSDSAATWAAKARDAMDDVIRRSVEMRLVATLVD